MKKLALLLALMAATLAAHSQFGKEDSEDRARRVKLKVKSVTLFQSNYQTLYGKQQLSKEFKVNRLKYGGSGDLIEDVAYNERGTMESWVRYENDKKGNNTALANYNTDGTQISKVACRNSYDSLGRFCKAMMYQDTNLVYQVNYSYDGKGNMVQADNFIVTGRYQQLESVEKRTYDEKGRTLKIEHYDHTGNYISNELFKYDEGGRTIEKTRAYISIYKYGANGLVSEVTNYDADNKAVLRYRFAYEFN